MKARLVAHPDPTLVRERINRERQCIPDARTWFRYRNDERVAKEAQVTTEVVSQDVDANTTTVRVNVS